MSTEREDRPTCLVLLGSLEPSEPLASTLAFLAWCRAQPDAPEMEVLAMHPGPAADQVRELAPVSIVYDPQGWSLPRVAQRIGLQRAAAVLRAADLKRRLRRRGPVYVPDPAAAWLLHRLGAQAGPVVVHLHGTSPGLAELPGPDRDALVARGDQWIAGSDAMADAAAAAGVAADHIARHPDLLTLPGIGELDADFVPQVRAELAARHGIAPDAALVVGTGNVDWWTTPDAFVRVAWETTRREAGREVHFLWSADGATDRMLWPLRHDIRHAGLDGRVHIDTGGRQPWHHIAAGDVLVSSRLGHHRPAGHREAALMGRPVVWFDDPTAAPEADGPVGTAIAHLDIDAMADAVLAAVDASGDDGIPPPAGPPGSAWLPAVGGQAILDLLVLPGAHSGR